jgi:hypothetical protein
LRHRLLYDLYSYERQRKPWYLTKKDIDLNRLNRWKWKWFEWLLKAHEIQYNFNEFHKSKTKENLLI